MKTLNKWKWIGLFSLLLNCLTLPCCAYLCSLTISLKMKTPVVTYDYTIQNIDQSNHFAIIQTQVTGMTAPNQQSTVKAFLYCDSIYVGPHKCHYRFDLYKGSTNLFCIGQADTPNVPLKTYVWTNTYTFTSPSTLGTDYIIKLTISN